MSTWGYFNATVTAALYTKWSQLQRTTAIFLTPLSWIFGLLIKIRHLLYEAKWLPQYKTKAFTVSVGAIEAGGSGKTPVSIHLLQKLMRQNKKVGFLSRGYGRSTEGLVVRQKGEKVGAQEYGDEPALLLNRYADVPAAICTKRIVGADYLSNIGCDTIICDDAFSHRALERDLDIVVLRGEAPFADGHLLPRGHLREPLSSLQRADLIWLHYKSPIPISALESEVLKIIGDKPCICSVSHLALRDLAGTSITPAGQNVIGAAGIAHPQSFARMLEDLGLNVLDFIAFPDHCSFNRADQEKLQTRLKAQENPPLVVTAKDAVKLNEIWSYPRIWIADLEIEVIQGQEHLNSVLKSMP